MNERTISLHDLGRILLKNKGVLALVTFLCALGGFYYALTRPVEYLIEATFKEQGEIRAEGPLQGFKEALGGLFDSSQTPLLMKSQQILNPLIIQMGLQIRSTEKQETRRWLRNSLRAEMGKTLPEHDPFRFQNVDYRGEKPLKIEVRCVAPETFEVSWKKGKAQGRTGEKIVLGETSFTIAALPKKLKMDTPYHFEILPLNTLINDLRRRLLISGHKQNRSLFVFNLRYPDRILGAEIVNSLMAHYLKFLKKEHEQRVEQELVFLQRRQEELAKGFEKILEEQKSYLQNNVDTLGFIDLKQELEEVAAPYREFFLRTCSLEMEEKQLLAWNEHESPLLLEGTSIGPHLHRLHASREDLRRERDLIESALYAQAVPIRREEALFHVRADLQTLSTLNEAEQPFSLFCDPDNMILDWAQEVRQGAKEQKDFRLYVQNLSHLLSIREKFLQECSGERRELECVDLDTARRLLVESSRALDEVRGAKEKLIHLIEQLEKPSFELSSLSSFLHDEASQRLLSSAMQLHFQLQDHDNYSEKEQERAERSLALQRKILKGHLKRLLETEDLRDLLCQEKIASLQKMTLECIHRQNSVCQEQILDLISRRKESIKLEQRLLDQKMEELRSRMGKFPQKWYSERILKLRAEINAKLIQVVNQLAETKNIARHFHHVASRALDEAIPPLYPKKSRLALFSFSGAIMGFIPAYFILFSIGILRGLPVGADTLKALNLPFSGRIGRSEEEDLETLKRALLTMNGKKEIALIMGNGPDYYSLFRQLHPGSTLLLSRAPLDRAETLALIERSEGMIVTVCEESLEMLMPFLKHPHCTFLKA